MVAVPIERAGIIGAGGVDGSSQFERCRVATAGMTSSENFYHRSASSQVVMLHEVFDKVSTWGSLALAYGRFAVRLSALRADGWPLAPLAEVTGNHVAWGIVPKLVTPVQVT